MWRQPACRPMISLIVVCPNALKVYIQMTYLTFQKTECYALPTDVEKQVMCAYLTFCIIHDTVDGVDLNIWVTSVLFSIGVKRHKTALIDDLCYFNLYRSSVRQAHEDPG